MYEQQSAYLCNLSDIRKTKHTDMQKHVSTLAPIAKMLGIPNNRVYLVQTNLCALFPFPSASRPACQKNKIQNKGTIVTDWFGKNDISCSGENTKLLFLGTRARRVSLRENVNFSPEVTICGEVIREITSENLLGLVINNTITWKHHPMVTMRTRDLCQHFPRE